MRSRSPRRDPILAYVSRRDYGLSWRQSATVERAQWVAWILTLALRSSARGRQRPNIFSRRLEALGSAGAAFGPMRALPAERPRALLALAVRAEWRRIVKP